MKKAGDNTAYVAARYNPNYEIRQDQVMLLFDRVNSILTQTGLSFEKRLKAFENLILSNR